MEQKSFDTINDAPKRAAIIGGGAAGYFAALALKESSPTTECIIFEGSKKPLSKVLISGGGRCNVTTSTFDIDALLKNYPRGSKELRGPFHRFHPRDTIQWFESRGVPLKREEDGRMFPKSNTSETVAHCLESEAAKLGVKVYTDEKVLKIEREENFILSTKRNQETCFDRVILTSGGSKQSFALAEALGHTIVPPVPSLFSFEINDPSLHELSGVSLTDGAVSLVGEKKKVLFQERGPLLITHWGMSGPSVIKLSSLGARFLAETKYNATLRLNTCPAMTRDEITLQIQHLKQSHPKKTCRNSAPFPFPLSFWSYLLKRAGIHDETWADIKKEGVQRLVDEITTGKHLITGKGRFKEEFVTAGGVLLKEVDFRTMESRVCRGLFLAGEILDIDALTGGYNFQNAWTTGWIAGKSVH